MAVVENALARFAGWMTEYGDGWESADADRIGGLFTVGATFQASPFDDLIRGRQAIVDHFAATLGDWPNASFAAQVLGVGDTYGIAHWRAASSERALDGVLVAAFDNHGRCTSLRQWWHVTDGAGVEVKDESARAASGSGEQPILEVGRQVVEGIIQN